MKTEPKKRYIEVAYKLYSIEDGEKYMVEETKTGQPFQFISGINAAIDYFEDKITGLKKDEEFEFTIPQENAYGEYSDEFVINLPKSTFEIDGHIDEGILKEGNILPLMNNEGIKMEGIVIEVNPDTVVMDLNHPLAGTDLLFIGKVIENREATDEEIQTAIDNMISEGECGCGSCNCGSGNCGEDGCGS